MTERERQYRSYLLIVLMTILGFNFVDRIALGIISQDLKTDLHLSDTQLGFLGGLGFALFYSVMGIPIARWADRGNRVTIISLTTALWSIAVALCAAASGFFQLFLIRIGVAVGEAGCIPPAHSLIADYFSRAERPRAVSRYMLGIPLAVVVAYFAAGWINQFYGWRVTFVAIGIPGVALALLARLTLKEPRIARQSSTEPARVPSQDIEKPASDCPLAEVCRVLWKVRAFRHLLVCFSIWYFFAYGLSQWTPVFFIRSHGMQTGELGTWFALLSGLASVLGIYLGGQLATRYAANNEPLQLRACALAFVWFALLNIGSFLASDRYLALAAMAIALLGANMVQGPVLATIQTLVHPQMRAQSIAIVYLFANLIGMGLGPLAAGALSDALQASLGKESLRYSLIVLCPGYFWAAWHLWQASRTVIQDLQDAQHPMLPAAAET